MALPTTRIAEALSFQPLESYFLQVKINLQKIIKYKIKKWVFGTGMDLQDFMELGPRLAEIDDVARKCKIIEVMLKNYQDYISALERCSKPVIAAVHNACIGGALDLLTATDIRMCSSDAWFQVKEVEIGMAADVGTLQRLPRVIGNQSLVNELCLTARKMPAIEAKDCGFVSQIFDDKERFEFNQFEFAANF